MLDDRLKCGKKKKNQMPPGKRWSNNARQKNIKKRDIINKDEENKEMCKYVMLGVNMRICM